MAEFMLYLRDYQEICQEVLNDPKFSDVTLERAGKKYQFMARLTEIEDLIAELQSSYFSKILSTKKQSVFSKHIQNGFNYVAHKISFLEGAIKEPREWYVVKVVASQYTEKTLKKLVPFYSKDYSASEAFQKYIHAIEADRLVYAKWLSQTMIFESLLNWEKEVVDFENYRRNLRRLLDIYHYVEDIIYNMMQIQSDVWGKVNSGIVVPGFFKKSEKMMNEAFLYSRKIDKLRILMRLAYLKKIKTDINNTEKRLLERISTSFNNKLQRYFMEGNIIDQTLTYPEVMQGDFEEVITEFNYIAQSYKFYLASLTGKSEVARYLQEHSGF